MWIKKTGHYKKQKVHIEVFGSSDLDLKRLNRINPMSFQFCFFSALFF